MFVVQSRHLKCISVASYCHYYWAVKMIIFLFLTGADPQILLEEKIAAQEKLALSEYDLRLAKEDLSQLKLELQKHKESSPDDSNGLYCLEIMGNVMNDIAVCCIVLNENNWFSYQFSGLSLSVFLIILLLLECDTSAGSNSHKNKLYVLDGKEEFLGFRTKNTIKRD